MIQMPWHPAITALTEYLKIDTTYVYHIVPVSETQVLLELRTMMPSPGQANHSYPQLSRDL